MWGFPRTNQGYFIFEEQCSLKTQFQSFLNFLQLAQGIKL